MQGKYKVYNLCSERLYDGSLFQGKVLFHFYFHFGTFGIRVPTGNNLGLPIKNGYNYKNNILLLQFGFVEIIK